MLATASVAGGETHIKYWTQTNQQPRRRQPLWLVTAGVTGGSAAGPTFNISQTKCCVLWLARWVSVAIFVCAHGRRATSGSLPGNTGGAEMAGAPSVVGVSGTGGFPVSVKHYCNENKTNACGCAATWAWGSPPERLFLSNHPVDSIFVIQTSICVPICTLAGVAPHLLLYICTHSNHILCFKWRHNLFRRQTKHGADAWPAAPRRGARWDRGGQVSAVRG